MLPRLTFTFHRRTLALIALVAAFAGGVSGGLTSSVTTPQTADAAFIKSIGKAKTDSQMIKLTYENSLKMSGQLDRIEANQVAIEAKQAALEAKLNTVEDLVNNLFRFTARGTDGRSLTNIVQSIEHHVLTR